MVKLQTWLLKSLNVRTEWNKSTLCAADSGSRLSPLFPQSHHQPLHPHAHPLRLCCHNPDAHTSGLVDGRWGWCPGGLRSGYHSHTHRHGGGRTPMLNLCLFFSCVCWKVHGEIWGTTSSLLLIPSPTRCHRWSKNSIQVGTDEGGSSEWEYWSWFGWFLLTEGGSETESTVDSELGRGDILATTSSESFFSYKPRCLVLLTLHLLFQHPKTKGLAHLPCPVAEEPALQRRRASRTTWSGSWRTSWVWRSCWSTDRKQTARAWWGWSGVLVMIWAVS